MVKQLVVLFLLIGLAVFLQGTFGTATKKAAAEPRLLRASTEQMGPTDTSFGRGLLAFGGIVLLVKSRD